MSCERFRIGHGGAKNNYGGTVKIGESSAEAGTNLVGLLVLT